MATIGLRELRQDASAIVRRVEDGESIDVTVSGRLAARLVPAEPKQWRRWEDLEALFVGRSDPNWADDMDLVDHTVVEPWDRSE